MNSVKIFEALGEVDDELIERADRPKAKSRRAGALKKLLLSAACVVLVVSLALGGGMMMLDENMSGANNSVGMTPATPTVRFNSFEDFISYANDIENQTVPVAPEAVIDFSSVIATPTCITIDISNDDVCSGYTMSFDNSSFGINVIFFSNQDASSYLEKNKEKNEIPYDSINDFGNLEPQKKFLYISIDDNELIYGFYYTNMASNERTVGGIIFVIENFVITLSLPRGENYEAFGDIVTSLNPDYGATDDSVVDMINRIKALIPQ